MTQIGNVLTQQPEANVIPNPPATGSTVDSAPPGNPVPGAAQLPLADAVDTNLLSLDQEWFPDLPSRWHAVYRIIERIAARVEARSAQPQKENVPEEAAPADASSHC